MIIEKLFPNLHSLGGAKQNTEIILNFKKLL